MEQFSIFFINKNYERLFAQLETCPSSSSSNSKKMAPRFSSEFLASPWIISFFLAFYFFLFAGKFSLKLIALNCYLFCKTESSLCYWSCRYCRIPGEIKSSSRITLRWHWWSNEKFSTFFFQSQQQRKDAGQLKWRGCRRTEANAELSATQWKATKLNLSEVEAINLTLLIWFADRWASGGLLCETSFWIALGKN